MSAVVASITPKNAKLLFSRIVYYGYSFTVTTIIIFVYQALMSRGLVGVFPDLGMKLSRVAGLGFLANYTATYRLSLAQIAAVIPLILAYIAYQLLLEMYLRPKNFEAMFTRWESVARLKRAIFVMATIIIIGDACLFAAAFLKSGWGPSNNPVAAVLATIVYQAILAFSCFVGMVLSDACTALQEGEKNETPTAS